MGNAKIIMVMSGQNTDALNGKRPFEETVIARFDAIAASMRDTDSRLQGIDSRLQGVDSRLQSVDSRLQNLEVRANETNSRLQKLEIRAYDTKPIWEQALREIVDTRRELSKRLDRIEAIAHETRADLRDAEDRLDKIGPS